MGALAAFEALTELILLRNSLRCSLAIASLLLILALIDLGRESLKI
jgi:hypothetical protein